MDNYKSLPSPLFLAEFKSCNYTSFLFEQVVFRSVRALHIDLIPSLSLFVFSVCYMCFLFFSVSLYVDFTLFKISDATIRNSFVRDKSVLIANDNHGE